MRNKKILFKKIYLLIILNILFVTGLTEIKIIEVTAEESNNKIHWESNTRDENIDIPDGLTGDGGKWDSPTYISSDDDMEKHTVIDTNPMNEGEEYAAILAALVGVLALSATKSASTSNETIPEVAEGNGIWVPESDRIDVINMINKAASKEYYIDNDGFVQEVPGSIENQNKSSTYSSVIDRLIKGNNKVVIGVNDGWVSSGENGLEANVFTGNTSGITIGDNGTPQVVIVSGKDVEGSSADITLAHELIHALRGEEEIKSINLIGGINKDEEAHTIELENKIRHELGYDYRKDGDKSDGGDASYGEFKDQLTGNDWYDNIDKISKSHTLSGNPYANSIIGAIVHAAKTAASIISSSSKKKKHSSSSSSSRSNNEWGSNYDDSVWTNIVTPVIDKIVSSVDNWRSTTKPKQDWNAFWNTTSSKISDSTKKNLSIIGSAIKKFASKILPVAPVVATSELVNQFFKPVLSINNDGWVKDFLGNWYYYENGKEKTGWIQDNGNWYYLDTNGKMAKGWIQDNGNWYYLNDKGQMLTGWFQDKDKNWYYTNDKGEMQTGWIQDKNNWYYLNNDGKMATYWSEIDGKQYYFYSTGEMATNWVKLGENNDWYYFNSYGEMQTGWLKDSDGDWFYLDDSGKMQTGWLPGDNGQWYYFYSTGDMATNWVELGENNDWYYFNSDGEMQTGWIQDNGKWYYANNKGEMQTGWVEDNGEWYYLKEKGDLAVGWVKYDDPNGEEKWYYFDENGSSKTGFEQDSKGNWYYIQSDHTLLKNDTLYLNGKEYYFYSEGIMAADVWLEGENGKWWYYNSDGESETGWVNVNGNYYYLDSEHNLATGWFKVDNKWYYSDGSGKMQTGVITDNGQEYYLNDDGSLKVGWVYFDDSNKWYHFDENGTRDNEYISNHEVYKTNAGPWKSYDHNDPEQAEHDDTGYNDYSKEDLLNIHTQLIGFKNMEFFTGLDNYSADQLFAEWKSMFRAAISGEMEDVALDMIDHFRYGDGTDYSNEILTEKVKEHPSTQAFADQMLASLKEGLAKYNGDLTSIDKSLFDSGELSLGKRPVFNKKPDDIFNGLTLTIDDTWANKVEVNDYYFDGENYSGTMKITIIDEFGLGLDDINDKKIFGNFEEFRAWFMLQHYEGFNGAYKPFNTVIELEYPFEGSIS